MQRALLGCALVGFTNGFPERVHRAAAAGAARGCAQRTRYCRGWRWGRSFSDSPRWGLFSGAVVAALLVGIGGQLVARSSRLKDETAIGALYTLAFAVGIILIKYSRVPVDLTHFPFRQYPGCFQQRFVDHLQR